MVVKIMIGIFIGAVFGAVMGYFGKCTSGACPLTANPFRGVIYGAFLGALVVVAFPASSCKSRKTASPAGTASRAPITHIESQAELESGILKNQTPALVDFYSDSCPACRALEPTIERIARKYDQKVTVAKVNVQKTTALARKYNIRAIPTVLIINNGQIVKRLLGARSENAYIQILDNLINGNPGGK